MKRTLERWYFETSGFNQLLKVIDLESFLNTRELQEIRGRELLVSPITLWEIMLTANDSDFLVFSAQNFFHKDLLATPTEIIIRYLDYAYPLNKINYQIFTDLKIRDQWTRMTIDNSIKFVYNKKNLIEKSNLIRKISKNLPSILHKSQNLDNDDFLKSFSDVVHAYYKCLLNDNFLPKTANYDYETLYKLVIIFVIILFILRVDFDSSIVITFWQDANINMTNPTTMLIYFFEKYPLLFKKGPILEMAIMAYNQVKHGKTNRGLIFDCYHMVYAPYVNYIVTGDEGFARLSQTENRYKRKIIHINELNFNILPYIK